MLFTFVRIILWLILSALAICKVKRSALGKKKLMSVCALLLCAILTSVTSLFPPGNLLIRCKSPETIFHYAASGEIDEILYGQDSCLVVFSKGNGTGGYYIIPMEKGSYRIPNCFTYKKISQKFDENGLFEVYHVNETQDYYVFGTIDRDAADGWIEVYNERGEIVKTEIVKVDHSGFIYFYLHDFTGEYCIKANGKIIPING